MNEELKRLNLLTEAEQDKEIKWYSKTKLGGKFGDAEVWRGKTKTGLEVIRSIRNY